MNSTGLIRKKDRALEKIKGSSLSSIVGSTSKFIRQVDKDLNPDLKNSIIRSSAELLQLENPKISHHRSNTVPARYRKVYSRKFVDVDKNLISPKIDRRKICQDEKCSQPFSPSLLQVQPRRRIRVIDDTDEGESLSSSTINRDE